MKRLGVVLIGIVLAACGSTTDEGGNVANVVGTWDYTAEQEFPAIKLTGTLRIEEQNGARIEGELEARENENGVIRNRAGIITGRVLSDGTIDFDVYFETTVARRHIGSVRTDSISGDWIQTNGNTAPLNGIFSAKRAGQ